MSSRILLIKKPSGWTSFDLVAKIRSKLKNQANSQQPIAGSPRLRVGHTGTLDPFATGLLIILIGDETKNQDKYMKLDKSYLAELFLGATSSTGDPEGKITTISNYKLPITKQELAGTISKYIGDIKQVPPNYSAIKVHGRPAYKLAREGKSFKLEPRMVRIDQIKIIDYKFPKVTLEIACSSGTYIRTLAEDIGKSIGCGAYLTALCRNTIGDFSLEQALSLEEALAII